MNTLDLKPCPFCGSKKLGYSLKIKRTYGVYYHATIYCKVCKTYGPRVITAKDFHKNNSGRAAAEENKEFKVKAAEAWNTRVEKQGEHK